MKNENPLQMDLFAQAEEKETFETAEELDARLAPARTFHKGTSANAEEYVNKVLNLYKAEGAEHYYDLRDDDLIADDEVIGYCMACNKPVTKKDACEVNAFNYLWEKKDGRIFNAWLCRVGHSVDYTEKAPGSMGPGYYYDFHKKYLELCEITEAEYIENLRQESPTVFKARQDGGQYVELCKEWAEAGKNDAGVFVKNVKKYEAGKRCKMWIMIDMAKAFPFIYAEMDLEARDYGKYSPLTDEEEWDSFKFSVFQPAAEILEGLKKQVEGRIDRNGNLDDDARAKLKALLPKVLGQLEKDLI